MNGVRGISFVGHSSGLPASSSCVVSNHFCASRRAVSTEGSPLCAKTAPLRRIMIAIATNADLTIMQLWELPILVALFEGYGAQVSLLRREITVDCKKEVGKQISNRCN